jgi:hypothetical protein
MNEQCKFTNAKGYRCGSYAFNLYKEQIDQGDRCDHHYWQERAMEAEALVDSARADEREACAGLAERRLLIDENKNRKIGFHHAAKEIAAAIRARGTT